MKGPKAILSQAIANAVSEYFIVDDPTSAIESQLSGDAEIVLHDVKLKEQILEVTSATCGTVTGTVDRVSFRWHWGKDDEVEGSSDWVRNANLEMKGLQFLVKLDNQKSGNPNSQSAVDSNAAEGRIMGYVNDQIQRIMDTLTLDISDFECRVQLPLKSRDEAAAGNNPRLLVMGGTRLKMEAHGKTATHLKQDMTISNIVWFLLSPEGQTIPVLAPGVSYRANIVRAVSYNAVDAGMAKGYRVLGECLENERGNREGFVFHAGLEQINFMLELMDLVTEPESDPAQEFTPVNSNGGSEVSDNTNEASFFQMPLSPLSVMLPNNTKLSFGGLVVCKYRMDGSLMAVEGRTSFSVNGFQFLSLGETCLWQMDLVRSRFVTTDMAATKYHKHNELVAFLHGRPEEMGQLQEGMTQAADAYEKYYSEKGDAALDAGIFEDVEVDPFHGPMIEASTGWTFHLRGVLGILWEGEEEGEVRLECALQGITGSSQLMSVDIMGIESMFIPGMINLKEPIEMIELTFDGSVLDVRMGTIVATLEEIPESRSDLEKLGRSVVSSFRRSFMTASDPIPKQTTQHSHRPSPAADDGDPDSAYVMPFGLKATFEKVVLYKPLSDETAATFYYIQLALGPDDISADVTQPAIRGALSIYEIRHYLVSASALNLTGLVYTNDFDTIHNYHSSAQHFSLASGYSAFDWERLFNSFGERSRRKIKKGQRKREKKKTQQEKPEPLKMPYARIDKLKVRIVVSSDLVGVDDTTLHLGIYKGKKQTTVDDILQAYISRVLSRTPTMITNIDVLGINLKEGSSSYFGSLLGAALFTGLGAFSLPVGGILGVASLDGIKRTIKEGKKARGAEPDDKYQLFDFTRGAIHIAVETARKGAERRGKARDKIHDPIDWAVGATADFSTYARKNKRKLGAAGAGTVGFGCGMVLGGPIVAMLGGLVCWAAAGKAIATMEEHSLRRKQMRRAAVDIISESFEQTLQIDDAMANRMHRMPVSNQKPKPSTPEGEAPVLAGLLWKRRDFFKWDWQLLYFTVHNDQLGFYQTSDRPLRGKQKVVNDHDTTVYADNSGGRVKSITLFNLRIQADNDLSEPENERFVFTIRNNQQSEPLWVLASRTRESRLLWLETLCNANERLSERPSREISMQETQETREPQVGYFCYEDSV